MNIYYRQILLSYSFVNTNFIIWWNNSKFFNLIKFKNVNIHFKVHESVLIFLLDSPKKLIKRHEKDCEGLISINELKTRVK